MNTFHKHLRRRSKAASNRRRMRQVNQRPRLSVCRSLTNISCQIIDDFAGHTLAAASSLEKTVRGSSKGKKKAEVAAAIGTLLAERAKAKGIVKVAFDRGSYKYHGRVKALADAARAGGLEF
jgi:large subunit ribosomal protein L18